jgi:hypothetical protein
VCGCKSGYQCLSNRSRRMNVRMDGGRGMRGGNQKDVTLNWHEGCIVESPHDTARAWGESPRTSAHLKSQPRCVQRQWGVALPSTVSSSAGLALCCPWPSLLNARMRAVSKAPATCSLGVLATQGMRDWTAPSVRCRQVAAVVDSLSLSLSLHARSQSLHVTSCNPG